MFKRKESESYWKLKEDAIPECFAWTNKTPRKPPASRGRDIEEHREKQRKLILDSITLDHSYSCSNAKAQDSASYLVKETSFPNESVIFDDFVMDTDSVGTVGSNIDVVSSSVNCQCLKNLNHLKAMLSIEKTNHLKTKRKYYKMLKGKKALEAKLKNERKEFEEKV
jgi:hypothetical protein